VSSQQWLLRLSFLFGLLAVLVAGLVSLGRGEPSLALLILCTVSMSLLFTDLLGWLRINSVVGHVAMLAGAVVAALEYLGSAETGSQLQAVANLLAYVQMPLFFQRKSLRVFEQLGAFITLQLVVAALLSDHVIFGLLLLPVVLVSCLVMMHMAGCATVTGVGRSQGEPQGWQGWLAGVLGHDPPNLPADPHLHLELSTPPLGMEKRGSASLIRTAAVISTGLVLLAVIFFYGLPRLHRGAYAGGAVGQPRVGFTDNLTLDQMGRILQDDQVVMRVELKDAASQMPYYLKEPPYLRGVVLDVYDNFQGTGTWRQRSLIDRSQEVPAWTSLLDERLTGRDAVRLQFIDQRDFGTIYFSVAPFFGTPDTERLGLGVSSWRLMAKELDPAGLNLRMAHNLITLGFADGEQSRLLPLLEDIVVGQPPSLAWGLYQTLLQVNADQFPSLLEIRDEVLEAEELEGASALQQALALEAFYASGEKFRYTLDLVDARDRQLDPIEDFCRNFRRGHCQYFASALALSLRSMGIPARVVAGYRPSDFNTLGSYFLVRQLHAHSWVEAFFTPDQFAGASLECPPEFRRGAWVRFDPTPAGEGSNAGIDLRQPRRQTLDFAQQIWRDYVVRMDQTRQGRWLGTWGEGPADSYANAFRWIQDGFDRPNWSRGWRERLSAERWFSWQTALIFTLVAGSAALASRWGWTWLRGHRPHWQRRARADRLPGGEEVDFYRQLLRWLSRAGWRRRPTQTHLELVEAALVAWGATPHGTGGGRDSGDSNGTPAACPEPPQLDRLTAAYYRLRFGGEQALTVDEAAWVTAELTRLQPMTRQLRRS